MTNQSANPFIDVATAVTKWIEDTVGLLAQAQTALESLRFHPGITPDVERTIYQLLVLLRQRRTDAPTPDAVRNWLRALAEFGPEKGAARFLKARSTDDGAAQSPPLV